MFLQKISQHCVGLSFVIEIRKVKLKKNTANTGTFQVVMSQVQQICRKVKQTNVSLGSPGNRQCHFCHQNKVQPYTNTKLKEKTWDTLKEINSSLK